jgi:GDP-L-fucose synthase
MKKTFDITKKTILITGAYGFLGNHLVEELKKNGAKKIIRPTSKEYNLLDLNAIKKIVKNVDGVIHLAAKVGGIGFNREHPAEMFYENIIMGVNLMNEAWKAGVEKFVALGTICCYPKFTPVPFQEKNLWNGYPEETNAPYGLAKKMLLVQAQAYRAQYGFNAVFVLPVNLYGPGDNFNPESSHVIPAIIKKFIDAKIHNSPTVTIWGTGKATREFFYVKDAALALRLVIEYYDKPDPINLGAGFEISIKDLTNKIRTIIGYKGKIIWDKTKPDGQPRRMLDTSRAKKEFGFVAKTDFDKGLRKTIEWYEQHRLDK